jgi:hypothetical protein
VVFVSRLTHVDHSIINLWNFPLEQLNNFLLFLATSILVFVDLGVAKLIINILNFPV